MNQIQELALRDVHGNVKRDLYQSVLPKLKIKDLEKTHIPPVFNRNIASKSSDLANTTIQNVMAFTAEDIVRVFGRSTRPIQNAFDKFCSFVENEVDTVYQSYLSNQKIIIDLEITSEDTIIDVLDELFLFCNGLYNINVISAKEYEKLDRLNRYFQGEQLAEICLVYNESNENARNLIKNKNIFVEILKGESNFTLNQNIYNLINSFKNSYTNNSKFFDHNNFSQSEKEIVYRKLEFLDLVAFDFETDRNRTYLAETEVLRFRGYLNAFNQFVKKTDDFYTLSELYLEFDEYYAQEKGRKLENTLDIFAKTVNQFAQLDKKWDESINQYIYSTQWNYLATTPLKISRILLDQKRRMSTSEIFEEFNKRSIQCGEEVYNEIPDLFVKSSPTVHSVQHGYWIYSKEKIEKRDVRDVINEFILSQNGVVRFEEVKAHVKALKYTYPDNSIRAYIQNFARRSVADPDLFVHEDHIESAGIEVYNRRNNLIGKELIPVFQHLLKDQTQNITKNNFQKLVSEHCKALKIQLNSKNSIYNYIDRFFKWRVYDMEDGMIIASTIDHAKLQQIEYRPEPGYRKHIRNEAVAILKETENNRLRIKDIYDQLIHLLPKNVSNTSFYKIFTISELFTNIEIDGKLYYQLEVDLLPVAKPFTEKVYEPEEAIVHEENNSVEEFLEQTINEEVEEVAFSPASASAYNFGFELNNQQIFDFIYNELNRKYKNATWFTQGFNDFKTIMGDQSNFDQHWGAKILKSLGRVLVNISDFYDRDSCLQRLSLSFETYLKQFDELKVGQDRRGSLGELIHQSSKMSVLLNYSKAEKFRNAYHRDDVVYGFSKSLSKIWHYRNTYAHDQESDALEITISDHIRYIMDFIGLYIFIPYYLKEVN
ncbi:MAG: hypothetical protein RSF68_00865 [Myroides sp.]